MNCMLREPSLRDVLADPIVKSVMSADGVDPIQLSVSLRTKAQSLFGRRGVLDRLRDRSMFHDVLSAIAFFVGVAMLFLAAGCASDNKAAQGSPDQVIADDPIEPVNRTIFGANEFVDRTVLKPVARAYSDDVPTGVQQGLHNFFGNLKEPVVGANHLLQGNADEAGASVARFAVNSTVGGGGIFDVAAHWGVPAHEADFGQTLGVWGLQPGAYIELPLLGPSNVRDTAGFAVDLVMDPFTWANGTAVTDFVYARAGAQVIMRRAELLPVTDDVDKNALDPYAQYRSYYTQRRAALVEKGVEGDQTTPVKQ